MGRPIRKIARDENTRAKIQAGNIIDRLCKHISGDIQMSPTQVQAAKILLAKVLPDMQAVESTILDARPQISAKPVSPEDWIAKHTATEEPQETTH